MKPLEESMSILIAEDDPDDRLLIREALEESRLGGNLYFVEDGEELMDYLYRRGNYVDKIDLPQPCLILLDLNMPKKDGREALKEIKAIQKLKQIPVVVLTTSEAEEDIYFTYEAGGNSFITKPVSFDSLVEIMKVLGKYWFKTAELPFCSTGE